MAPAISLASDATDPIFALIEKYRTAAEKVAVAASEVSRREEMLIEQGLGSKAPSCPVSDMSQFGRRRPVMVHKHEYVDIHIPPDRFSKVNAAAHAELDAKIEQHKAIMGDSEAVMCAAQDAETDVLDTLVWTVPTSIAGVLALLEFWPEVWRTLDDDQVDALLAPAAEALRDLHPTA